MSASVSFSGRVLGSNLVSASAFLLWFFSIEDVDFVEFSYVRKRCQRSQYWVHIISERKNI